MKDSVQLQVQRFSALPSAFPSVVELQTTTVCNARCCTCPYEQVYGSEPGRRMADSLLWKILEECKDNRQHIGQIIPYHNNEPLTDTRIFDILHFIAQEIRVGVELSTNASLLTSDERCERLLDAVGESGTIRISFFGALKETYERRMAKLRWEVTCANIARLLEARKLLQRRPTVEIVMIAYAGLTEEEVAAARAMWEGPYGARVAVFGYLDRAGNMATTNVLPLVRHRARLIGCDLNRPMERINILADGRAVLCSQDWKGEVPLGNVAQESIGEIWRSDAYKAIRRQIAGHQEARTDLICRSCKIAIFE